MDELAFPKTSWSQWRMGTAAGLFWLDEARSEAILPLHGINKTRSEHADGGWMYDYTIGAAFVKKVIEEDGKIHLRIENISKQPLIVPRQLDHLISERFNFRHIVYSCGVWRDEEQGQVPVFNFLVNKGDKGTVLVKISQDEMKASLGLPLVQENVLVNAA